MIEIKPVKYDDVVTRPEFPDLALEYGKAQACWGSADPQSDIYHELEKLGLYQAYGAFDDDGTLVGFAGVVKNLHKHTGRHHLTVQDLFCAKKGAGLPLLRYIERAAKAMGEEAIVISAPAGSRLCSLLGYFGYKAESTVFFKEVEQDGD